MMRGYLRITTLKAIEKGHKTGYSIIKYINEKTGRKPSYGSIYPLLEQLENEGLINTTEKDRKKTHNLTKKGKEELKNLTEQKNKLLDKLEEGICIFATISNMKSMASQLELIKRMRDGDALPIDTIPEIDELKKTILELILNNPNKAQKKEIIKIVKRTNKELKTIK